MTEVGIGRISLNAKGDAFASCRVCWDGPSGRYGQGYSNDFRANDGFKQSPETRARRALAIHIRQYHGMELDIQVVHP